MSGAMTILVLAFIVIVKKKRVEKNPQLYRKLTHHNKIFRGNGQLYDNRIELNG